MPPNHQLLDKEWLEAATLWKKDWWGKCCVAGAVFLVHFSSPSSCCRGCVSVVILLGNRMGRDEWRLCRHTTQPSAILFS